MDQLDPKGVANSQQRWLGQEPLCSVLMSSKEPQQTGAFGQVWKQIKKVALDPAMERPAALALEGEQDSQRNDLAGMQAGSGVLGHISKCVVYAAE
jgi:hypothetical protein